MSSARSPKLLSLVSSRELSISYVLLTVNCIMPPTTLVNKILAHERFIMFLK